MKSCVCCGRSSVAEAKVCPSCGEASWSLLVSATNPPVDPDGEPGKDQTEPDGEEPESGAPTETTSEPLASDEPSDAEPDAEPDASEQPAAQARGRRRRGR